MSEKHIFWQLQLSNYNNEGNYMLEGDSNFNLGMMRIRKLLERNPEWKFYVTVPSPHQIEHSKSKKKEFKESRDIPEQVKLITVSHTDHAVKNRYHFDFNEIEKNLRFENKKNPLDSVDLLVINDPVMTKHWKVMFDRTFDINPPVITLNHFADTPSHPKVPEKYSYWFRQLEAAHDSDLHVLHCLSEMKRFLANATNDLSKERMKKISGTTTYWENGFSAQEINQAKEIKEVKAEVSDKRTTIVFPCRLSSTNYTNWEKFIKAAEHLYSHERNDFEVIVTDPSQNAELEKFNNEHMSVRKIKRGLLTRNEYITLLKEADIVASLYQDDTYGGIAWREAIYAGCAPLSPMVNEYKRHFDAVSWPEEYTVDEPGDVTSIKQAMNKLLSSIDKKELQMDFSQLRKRIVDECEVENIIGQVENDMEKLMEEE